MSAWRRLAVVVCFLCVARVHGAEPRHTFTEGAKAELLWSEGEFTEGVACAPDGVSEFQKLDHLK